MKKSGLANVGGTHPMGNMNVCTSWQSMQEILRCFTENCEPHGATTGKVRESPKSLELMNTVYKVRVCQKHVVSSSGEHELHVTNIHGNPRSSC